MPTLEVKQWLQGLELTDEQRGAIETALSSEKNQQRIKEDLLRQSDYSRRMNELATQRQQAEAEYRRQFEELATWKQGADETLASSQARLAKEAAEKAKLLEYARQYNIPVDEFQATEEPPVVTQPNKTSPSNPPSVRAEDLEALRAEALSAPIVNAKMFDIAARYRQLHGKEFSGMTEFIQEAISQRVSLDDLAEQKFSFAEREAELKRTAHEAELQRVRDETELRVRSELNAPAPRPDYARSIVLSTRTTPAERPMNAVDAAVASFNEGKYRAQG